MGRSKLSALVILWADSLPENFTIYREAEHVLFDLKQDKDSYICYIVFANFLRQSVLLDKTFTPKEIKNVLSMTLATFQASLASL